MNFLFTWGKCETYPIKPECKVHTEPAKAGITLKIPKIKANYF